MDHTTHASRAATQRPFENCYWVEEGRLLAGEYPGDECAARARAKLDALLDAGITHFVDLTEATEHLEKYEYLLREQAEKRGCVVTYSRRPIRDQSVPRPDAMVAMLDDICAALAARRRVYVHCWGGIGRTGTVVGCYLVRRGRTGDGALNEVDRLFRTMSRDKQRRHGRSPDTSEQLDMVRKWPEARPA